MRKNTKKPIFKRWWFWLIIVILASSLTTGKNKKQTVSRAGGSETVQNAEENPVDVPEQSISLPVENEPVRSIQPEDIDINTGEPLESGDRKEPASDVSAPHKDSESISIHTQDITSEVDPSKTEEPKQDTKLEVPPENDTETSPQPEPESEPDLEAVSPKIIHGFSADTIVYVSKRSNTIHSINNCSGMKNYREMTLGQADERNYKYCKDCW